MSLFIVVALIGLLSVVVYQDFKSKEISWLLIPLLFVGFLTKAFLTIEFTELLTYFGINLTLVTINLLGVTMIISLKEKKLTNILNSHLGLGDVLFFLVITVVFSPINFVAFYLGSILTITLIYGAVILANKNKKTLVPLAGAMSLLLIIAMMVEQIIPLFNFYQDILQ